MKPTYELASDLRSIRCLMCGLVSHNPSDALHRYCARCNVFHLDLQPCAYCDEAIMPGEPMSPIIGASMHWECGLRGVIGGLNHLLGKCSCCGGTEPPDPADLTTRQAALAAVEHYFKVNPQHGCNAPVVRRHAAPGDSVG